MALLAFFLIQLWFLAVGACLWRCVLGDKYELAILGLVALIFGAVFASRGQSSWLAVAFVTIAIGMVGWFVAKTDRSHILEMPILPLYIAAVLLWMIRRIGNVFRVFAAYEWPFIGLFLSVNSGAVLEPGSGKDYAPELSDLMFRKVMLALLAMSLAFMVIEGSRYLVRMRRA